MLARRSSDSHIVAVMTRALKDILFFADYERAKNDASERIVRRQSRGSIMAQNSWTISRKQLRRMSERADDSMRKLRKAFG